MLILAISFLCQIVMMPPPGGGGAAAPSTCSTKPTYFNYAIGITDSAAVVGSDGAQTAAPASMTRGDLIVVFCNDRANVDFSVTSDGGQIWTAGASTLQGTTCEARMFWATFNGTWTTQPYFSTTGTTTPFTTSAHVFRPCDTTHAWGASAAELAAGFAAPSAPFRMIAPTITTGKDSSVVVSFRATADDNSDTTAINVPGSNLMTRSGTERGLQNIGGTDTYQATYYKIYDAAGATGADTVFQSNRGGDLGVYIKAAFYDSTLALASVTLLTPTDTQTGISLNPTFTWSAVGYGYVSDQIQIDSVSTSFGALTKDSTVYVATATFGGLSPSKTYYWRVRRTNYTGEGDWSTAFSFTTGTGSTPPTLVQGTGVDGQPGSFVKAYTSDVTSGNLLIVSVDYVINGCGTDAPLAANLTQSAGTATIGTILMDTSYVANSGACDLHVAVFSVPVTGTGSCTFTFASGSTQYGSMAIYEVSDLGTGVKDVCKAATAATGAPTTASYNTSSAGFIVGALATDVGSATTHTSGTNYTTIWEYEDGSAGATGSHEYWATTSAQTGIVTDWSAPATIPWTMCSVAYK